MQRHLSTVIPAVIQAVILVKVKCGMAPVMYCTSTVSKPRPELLNSGFIHMFVQATVTRLPKSETAKPKS